MSDVVTFKYKLGTRVRDKVTGFVGIIDSRLQYLNGCRRYSVMPPVKEDGKMPEGFWIDELQLEYVDDGISIQPKETGGPMEAVRHGQKF